MQILFGFGDLGQVLHTEMVTVPHPSQLIALAQARLAHFARIEVWEEAVCVFRGPPRAVAG
jgi:hypothetical protein